MALKVEKPNLNKMDINFIPVDIHNADVYIKVGTQSYKEHYLHLWENSEPAPFINEFLSLDGLLAETKKPSSLFYIIQQESADVGILNFTLDKQNPYFPQKTNLLLNKLYLIRSASKGGIGKASLEFTEMIAKTYKKNIVWLYTMKKGRTKDFYERNGYKIFAEAEITLPHVLEDEKEMWVMAKML